jgi:hypothetical protein
MTGLDFLGEVSQDADISPAIVQKIEGLLAGLE